MTETEQSFLDRGASFEGKISFSGAVRIDGHFRGDARAPGTLVIGESGVVEANLEVGRVVVHGTLTGDVTARERIEIGSSGIVTGTLRAPILVVEEGAQVSAKIEMGAGSASADSRVQPDVAPRSRDLKSATALP